MNVRWHWPPFKNLPIENNNRFLRGGIFLTVYLRKAEPSDLPDILAIIEDGRRTLQKVAFPNGKTAMARIKKF